MAEYRIKYEKTMKVYSAIILVITAFVGIGAVGGACGMLYDPTGKLMGMDALLPYFQKLPFAEYLFKDLLFSGIALLIVNGISNLTAFLLIMRKKRIGYILGWVFGITLMLWISIQLYMFAPEIPFLDGLYFIIGAMQFIFGYLAYVNFRQLEFHFDPEEYSDIDFKNTKELVVYFSRMGYTKKLAYEKADRHGCGIVEIKAAEPIHGITGFWWCGRFAMHRWDMGIEPLGTDFSTYDRIYLYTPVWDFAIAAPVRKYLHTYGPHINSVEITIVHFITAGLRNTAKEAADILGREKVTGIHSISSHFGNVKSIF